MPECLVAQMVQKSLPAKQGISAWSLGQEDPLKKGMATRSSILAWRIPWTEEPGGLQSMGSQRVGHDWSDNTHTHILGYKTFILDIFIRIAYSSSDRASLD